MNETDVKDKRGNVVISPGLKVRHKGSQYEYTVDHVAKDGEEVVIMLSPPEEPRFEPAGETGVMADKRTSNVLYEIDPNASVESSYYVPSEEDFEEDDLLAVPAKEFEREYEVK
jgi:hypothetical protein